MAANNGGGFIGKIVSLVSVPNIRYEGTIHMIDNDKITLKNVRIFGTENRECEVFIGIQKDMMPVITFNRAGIRSINIIPQYSFFDPSIVQEPANVAPARQVAEKPQSSRFMNNTNRADAQLEDPTEEPITNDFDFEASNKKLEKDDANQTEAAPAYKKDNFFDTLEENKPLEGLNRRYRNENIETFGKKSLDEHNREYRNSYRNNNRNYNNGGYGRNQRWGHRGGYNRRNYHNGQNLQEPTAAPMDS
ncbi:hypothetical protein AV274_6088 [Blastocystis sp. ATCC 50177/Nand II]|uniref:DFDF domain-containing protein n=1 Tax=Blastocystis sp. subtype 1 (strain ATCC 50177 / NandII) TaxID=478820 RepID=A0A196S543_BLAHN|nr:hypothetical protein AV274_6088 [Blastocystis sp. ATCC 50177/Nand II]